MFGDVLVEIMRQRYIAVIDVARELRVAPSLVERWLRNEALPQPEDVVTLACLLGGSDAERLLTAVEQPGTSVSSTWLTVAPRSLDAAEREIVRSLPAAFRGAFASALERTPAE